MIAANMPWYTQNIKSGILELPTEGAPSTSFNPKLSRLPMYLPAVCEKARE